jgi:hypothetical protein
MAVERVLGTYTLGKFRVTVTKDSKVSTGLYLINLEEMKKDSVGTDIWVMRYRTQANPWKWNEDLREDTDSHETKILEILLRTLIPNEYEK